MQQLYEWLEQEAATGAGLAFDGPEDKSRVKNRIRVAVWAGAGLSRRRPVRKMVLRYAAAAAILLIIATGAFYMYTGKSQTAEIVLVSAPGEVRKATLPDGSTAWLNDNSELMYHADFAGRRTIVLRKGEAFFDVRKDPDHPFVVQSRQLSTTVLGTSFSVKTFGSSGNIKVSVATGRVLVSRQKDTLGLLMPSQRLRYIEDAGASLVDVVLAGEADGWTRGDLFLQNANLEEVIQWLQDHFKIKVNNKLHRYAGEYYLQVKNDIGLPQLIRILNLLGKKNKVQFSLQEGTIIIQ